MTSKLLYFADPMCSWCYGFAPQIAEIKTRHANIEFQLIMGGLRPFGRETMADFGHVLRHHWEEVHRRSGQEFNHSILDSEDYVYDTEPPSRAVITMRSIKPSAEFAFFRSVQEAFYRDNADTNSIETYAALAESFDVGTREFKEAYASGPMKEKTLQDFSFSQQMGVSGFPTTMLQTEDRFHLLAHGYAEAEQIIEKVDGLLN
jgi:putative protein-disulfide isomerase